MSCEQSRTERAVAVAASRIARLAVALRWSDCLEDTGAIQTFALHGAQADHTRNDWAQQTGFQSDFSLWGPILMGLGVLKHYPKRHQVEALEFM